MILKFIANIFRRIICKNNLNNFSSRLKPQYFFRDTEIASKNMVIELSGIMNKECLEVECFCIEEGLEIFANQIIVDHQNYIDDKFVFHNRESIEFKGEIVVPEPFNLILNNTLKSCGKFIVKPLNSLEVSLYKFNWI